MNKILIYPSQNNCVDGYVHVLCCTFLQLSQYTEGVERRMQISPENANLAGGRHYT